MGAEKEILDAPSLASGVETLRSGLVGFGSTTGQMKSIFEDFEGRLNKLEGEMLPMKNISAKLTLARCNITSAITKMENVNECFLLEKELRGVVQKGMRGNVGAVEYLEEMRRINDAIAYFRKWPSLKSQEEAIRGLEDLSKTAAKECIDEFNRLLRTVGPAVQFQARTNTFESVDTLSDHVAQSLAAIAECLTLLRYDRQLRQNYTSDRRVTVKTALDSWEAKFESNSRGQEARGGGPWLRFYVDFATKIVTTERLLWERALNASCAVGDERQSLEAEAAFVLVVAPVIEKLVREVDRRLNNILAETKERFDAAGASSADGISPGGGGSQIRAKTRALAVSSGLTLKEGDVPSDVVGSLLEMSDAMHKGSYSLQDILKVGDVSGSKSDKSGHRKRPSSSNGRGGGNKATEALAAVRRRLSQACLHTITNMAGAVSNDPKLRRHLPDDGSVHPLASNVLLGVKRLMRFRRGYEDLVKDAQLPWDPTDGGSSNSNSSSPVRAEGTTAAARACPKFTVLVNHLVKTLFVNLTEKSSSYPTATLPGAALRDIFLVNNAEYVLTKAKTPFAGLSLNTSGGTPSPTPGDKFRLIFGGVPSPGGDGGGSPRPGGVKSKSPKRWGFGGLKSKEAVRRATAARAVSEDLVGPDAGDDELLGLSIADFMTEQMKLLLHRLMEEKHASYMNTLLEPLIAAAKDDIGELKYQRGKLLTLECGRLVKAKFTAFNESWEEVFHSQLSVSVVEPSRKLKLRDELKSKCLLPYRELYGTYEGVQFSKKHQEQYLKYTPDAIQEGIGHLFSG